MGGGGKVAQPDMMATDVIDQLRIERKYLESPVVRLERMDLPEMIGKEQAVIPDVGAKVQRGRFTEKSGPDGFDPGEESLEFLALVNPMGVDLPRNVIERKGHELPLGAEMNLGHLRHPALRRVKRDLPPHRIAWVGFRKYRLTGGHV